MKRLKLLEEFASTVTICDRKVCYNLPGTAKKISSESEFSENITQTHLNGNHGD